MQILMSFSSSIKKLVCFLRDKVFCICFCF